MPRGYVTKVDALARVMKLKTKLYEGEIMRSKSLQHKEGAHEAFNLVLEFLDEYHT
jgi:hypothetical protein